MPNGKTEIHDTEVPAAPGDIRPNDKHCQAGELCPLAMGIAALGNRALVAALPATLAEMSRVIPVHAVLKIAERFGGTQVCFSRGPAANEEIERLVGPAAASALGRHYGGERRDIPRASAVFRAARNQEIRRVRAQGISVANLALRFGMTRRQINRIFNGKGKR